MSVALSCPGSTHTWAGESSFATATEPPFFSRKSYSFTTLGSEGNGKSHSITSPLPLTRVFCFSRSRAELARKPSTQRVPLAVCSLVEGRLSRGFSEKQLSSDPAGSTFLHDEGGIPVFTLNNVFLCLNRTHYVLNSSRFLAPHCRSSGTETGLRPLAEARANAGLV